MGRGLPQRSTPQTKNGSVMFFFREFDRFFEREPPAFVERFPVVIGNHDRFNSSNGETSRQFGCILFRKPGDFE